MKIAHSSPLPMREVEENILVEIRSSLSLCDPQYLDLQQKFDIVYTSFPEWLFTLWQVFANRVIPIVNTLPECTMHIQIHAPPPPISYHIFTFKTIIILFYRYTRRHWLDKLQLEFPIQMYHFSYGNSLGTMTFVWCLTCDLAEDPS